MSGNRLGAARAGSVTIGVAVVLSLGLVALAGPADLDTKQFLTAVAALAASAFGGDVVVSAGDTDLEQWASIGVYPLTVTAAALGVGAALFWRDVRGSASRLGGALLHAARAGLVLGLLLAVMTLVLRTNLQLPEETTELGLPRFAGESELSVRTLPAAIFAFAYMFVVCAAVCLRRRDWLPRRVLVVRDALAVPVVALLNMFAVICALGLVAGGIGIVTMGDPEDSSEIAALLAGAPNLGVWVFLLGGGAGFRLSSDSSLDRLDDVQTLYLTGVADELSDWVWLFPLGTILVLLSGAVVTVWLSRSAEGARRGLLRWLGTVVVATVALVHLSAVHVHAGSDSGLDFTGQSLHGVIGVSGWQAFLLMALWGFVAAVVVSAVLAALFDRGGQPGGGGSPPPRPTGPGWQP